MMTRIYFNWWHLKSYYPIDMPAYAIKTSEYVSDIDTVCRAIERKSGMYVITKRNDGTTLRHGKSYENQYQLTLGNRCTNGGWTPRVTIYVSIKIDR